MMNRNWHIVAAVWWLLVLLSSNVLGQYDQFQKALGENLVALDPSLIAGNRPLRLQGAVDPNFTILAIGEQSHGTSEFFKARISLIRSLAASKRITKIGLEAPIAEVERLNTYVSGGEGDLRQILRSFRLFNYECAEFEELAETVKTLNKSLKTPVGFFGFDMQTPFQSLQNLLESCLVNDKNTADSVRKLIENYQLLDNEMYNHSFGQADFYELEILSNHILEKLKRNDAACLKKDLISKSIRNYRQFLILNDPKLSQDTQANVRDSLMAENVLAMLKPDEKMVILAHNGHIQRTPNRFSKSMGFFLSRKLGDQYQSVGLTTSSGFYTAFTPEAGRITDQNNVPAAPSGAFEYYFSKVGKPAFLIKTSVIREKVKGGEVPSKYKLLPFGLTDKPFAEGNILADFDYILHIEKTTGNRSFYLK